MHAQALLDFQAVLGVVQKNGAAISRVVSAIARAQLCYVPEGNADGAVMGMQEFLDRAEGHRAEVGRRPFLESSAALKTMLQTSSVLAILCSKVFAGCTAAQCLQLAVCRAYAEGRTQPALACYVCCFT
jgi:hypothetical protein